MIIAIYLLIVRTETRLYLTTGIKGCHDLIQGIKLINKLEELFINKNSHRSNKIYLSGWTSLHYRICEFAGRCTLIGYFNNEYSKKSKKKPSQQEISIVNSFLCNNYIVLAHLSEVFKTFIVK